MRFHAEKILLAGLASYKMLPLNYLNRVKLVRNSYWHSESTHLHLLFNLYLVHLINNTKTVSLFNC